MAEDRVLAEMASELKLIIIDEGLDPHSISYDNLPWNSPLAEYEGRGGTEAKYDADQFDKVLFAEVARMSG